MSLTRQMLERQAIRFLQLANGLKAAVIGNDAATAGGGDLFATCGSSSRFIGLCSRAPKLGIRLRNWLQVM